MGKLDMVNTDSIDLEESHHNAKKFAPILIPTLCRYDKFKSCIESLQLNSGAEETELFIALDYPLKLEHKSGYDQINRYLETITGFKRVNVIRRERNMGAKYNIITSTKSIFEKYDRMILSEDDNVFSPNFLEFINKGLIRFENDKSIFAICGYRHFYNIKFDENNFFFQNADMSAWGYGIWRDRHRELVSKGTSRYFRKKLFNPITFFSIWRRGGNQLISFFIAANKKRDKDILSFPDGIMSIYMYLNRMYCVMPTVSKVRNTGFDGSGDSVFINDEIQKKHDFQEIDTESHFTYRGEDYFIKHNKCVFRKENYGKLSVKELILVIIKRYFKI